jgi:hypothetical protein
MGMNWIRQAEIMKWTTRYDTFVYGQKTINANDDIYDVSAGAFRIAA